MVLVKRMNGTVPHIKLPSRPSLRSKVEKAQAKLCLFTNSTLHTLMARLVLSCYSHLALT